MGHGVNPRHGSMQVWPRVRAKRQTARVRSWVSSSEAKPLGFAGYKVGMTHVQYRDEAKESPTKGEIVNVPVTIIECPPLRVMGIRAYKKVYNEDKVIVDVLAEKHDKHLNRKIDAPKKVNHKIDEIKVDEFSHLVLLVNTQPIETGLGKKTPEIFEVAIGGDKEKQLEYAKSVLGKDIAVQDVFKEGEYLDIHAITTGKGFQGPVKRFGVGLRSHKSEKVVRGPASLGPWSGQAHIMYRVAHAGQMGYHQRTIFNVPLFKIGDKPEDVNAKGGFIRYGLVKTQYVLVKGSVHGPKKRLIRFTKATRATRKPLAPAIEFISTASKQGNRV